MNKEQLKNTICVFGLGLSGIAAARYLNRTNQLFFAVDTRVLPPGKDEIENLEMCQASFYGDLPQDVILSAKQIILSPGVSPEIEIIKAAKTEGVEVLGDVEIFAKETDKKIVAITGSNGKSTVTDLTYQLLKASGANAAIGGNYGVPVLDFLPDDSADIYVLELSSFQLDTTSSLRAEVATVLNVTEDHMDRYASFEEYRNSKLKIYHGSNSALANGDDELTFTEQLENLVEFSLDKTEAKYHAKEKNSQLILMAGNIEVVNVEELNLSGRHNWSNALAAIAILSELNVSIDKSVVDTLKAYRGLANRFELVLLKDKCEWINDSKATNVGATEAALKGIDKEQYSKLVLIAGGDAKGSDLSPLKEQLSLKVDKLVLIGKDAPLLAELCESEKVCFAENMQEAVEQAHSYVQEFAGQKRMVLLSPACASLDMYRNFVARGEAFTDAVRACA